MDNLARHSQKILLGMVFFLPAWLTVGRPLVGAGIGWEIFYVVLFFVPATFVLLLMFYLILRMRNKKAHTRAVGRVDVLLLAVLYASILLYSAFLVSQPDDPSQFNSIASLYLGIEIGLSDSLANTFYGASLALLAVCFIVFSYELKTKKLLGNKKHRQNDAS